MTNRLAIATTATHVPMGAQVYQQEITVRAAAALASVGVDWPVQRVVARSLRSPLAGTLRLPMRRLERAGARERRALGALVYPRGALVHRMELGLPPARGEVLTMHDVVAWRFSDEGNPPASARDELRAAAAVICVSQSTADDVAEMFGVERVHVAHPGVDDRFREPGSLTGAERVQLGIPGRYLLHAGGASQRKNLEGLAAAWRSVHAAVGDVSLVLAGPPHSRRDELFRDLPRAIRVGRLPDGVLPKLMAGAEAVVVPSLYEGFGLPVLESMAAGTPVVAARTSSLPEVAGDAAVLVDPDGPAIAEGIRYVLGADFDRDGAVAAGFARSAGFDWTTSAEAHARVWKSVGHD